MSSTIVHILCFCAGFLYSNPNLETLEVRGEVCSRVQHPGSLTIVLDHCLHFVSSLTTVGRTDRSVLATLTSASAACRCVCRPHWQIIPATLEICILRLPTDWRPNLTTLYFQFSVRPLCIVRQLHIVAVRATLVAAALWQNTSATLTSKRLLHYNSNCYPEDLVRPGFNTLIVLRSLLQRISQVQEDRTQHSALSSLISSRQRVRRLRGSPHCRRFQLFRYYLR